MFTVIASEAKQSMLQAQMDCFVAALLAMTTSNLHPSRLIDANASAIIEA
jgi:hypothetical protein